uniref:TM2 domain containing 1 n=1 Tax=Cyprinus carpio TaxID=7962 RepID=A0A8C1V3P5_CYPCA
MASRWRSLLRFRPTTRPLIIFTFCLTVIHSLGDDVDSCDKLRLGYVCKEPKIDDATQEPENCKDRLAWGGSAVCRLSNGTQFKFSGEEVGFNKSIQCRNVSGYSYKVAVALSLFLGWIGADRFYLGYPALGLLKFCTVGFCGIGSLVDFMLISMQIVGPSDGSDYIVDYYGARLTRLSITNETYRRTQLSP